jgi:hypothetical protein
MARGTLMIRLKAAVNEEMIRHHDHAVRRHHNPIPIQDRHRHPDQSHPLMKRKVRKLN